MVNRDFFSEYYLSNPLDVDNLIRNQGKFSKISDIMQKALLFATALNNKKIKNYATFGGKIYHKSQDSGLKLLLHNSRAYNSQIQHRLSEIKKIGIEHQIDLKGYPEGTTKIEFPITLIKPYFSRDDASFYIIDSPIRKEKVFGIPFMSAMSWKGNLRWTMMKGFIEPKKDDINQFVEARIRHSFMFGTEKGAIDKKSDGWVNFLDAMCPNGKEKYKTSLKTIFKIEDIPNLKGSLYFYPTFWDKIDMEIYNPHDRQTNAGKNPIYLEVVPSGAKGEFHLLYLPHQWEKDKEYLLLNLKEIAQGLKEMMLIYGFSAKKSSGYGIIEENWNRDRSSLIIKGTNNIQEKFKDFDELLLNIRSLNTGDN